MSQLINRALVVDDSRLARIALSKLLQKRGVEVEVVGTGGDAIEFLQAQSALPDVVFMDYMMPDMDGFQATEWIRQQYQDAVPVVMYTSQDTADDREKARQLGIAGFLSKPSGEHNLDDVLSQLHSLIQSQSTAAAPGDTASEPTDASSTVEPEPEPQADSEPQPEAVAEQDSGSDTDGRANEAVAATNEAAPAPEVEEAALDVAEASSETQDRAGPVAADSGPAGPEPPEPATQQQPTEPVTAAPAGEPSSGATAPSADAMRSAAREVIQDLLNDALERFERERLEPLRQQVEAGSSGADELLDQARQAARSAAEETAEGTADRTARQIAENVAQETASRVSEEVGPEAAKRIMADVRKDVKSYVSELLTSDGFKKQVTEVVRDTAWPNVQEKVTEQVTASATKQAREAAAESASKEIKKHANEAAQVAERLVEERVAALRANLTNTTRETVDESVAGLKKLIFMVGGGLGIAVIASFAFSFFIAG